MIDQVLSFLSHVNDHYANILLLIIATGTLAFTYREYSLKRRPVVVPSLAWEIKEETWYILLSLTNHGMTPCHASIQKTVLKIGDEIYPTDFQNKTVLLPAAGTPTSTQMITSAGSINTTGRRKIKGHEYRENRCELTVELLSGSFGNTRLPYRSSFKYQIDVSGEQPVFLLISETFS